jgi:hypothetical protein
MSWREKLSFVSLVCSPLHVLYEYTISLHVCTFLAFQPELLDMLLYMYRFTSPMLLKGYDGGFGAKGE